MTKTGKLEALLAMFMVDAHWTKRSFARDRDGQTILQRRSDGSPPTYHRGFEGETLGQAAVPFCFCLDGAMVHCQCDAREEHNLKTAIIETGRVGFSPHSCVLWDYNDHPDTTVEDIRKVIRRAIEITEAADAS